MLTYWSRIIVFAFLLSLTVVGAVSAETAATCQVPDQYATIKSAVIADCTNIQVAAGVYNESQISIGSTNDATILISGAGQGQTIIDAQNTARIFNVYTANLVLADITLRNGAAHNGGAIFATPSKTVTLNNVELTDNAAVNYGGAIFAYTDVFINGGSITNNTAGVCGGAIATAENTYVFPPTPTFTIADALVQGNSAETGGAICIDDPVATLSVVRSSIDDNSADDNGGAIYNSGTVSLSNMSLTNNQAIDGDGGAIYSFGTTTLLDSYVGGNSALLGGGLMFFYGQYTIDRVSIDNNTATYYGGGLFTFGTSTQSSIEDFSISNNTAQNGAGVFVNGTARLNMARGAVTGNTASGSGGGIDGNVNLNQAAVIGNHATDSGGGVRTNSSRFINVTISGNSAGFSGSGLIADGLLASYTTIADNTGAPAIFNPTDGANAVQFENTIIDNPDVDNCSGESVQAIGINVIDSDGSCNFGAARASSSVLSGIDPMLAPLADNGGGTPTHALLAGSPAIGIGIECEGVDQRGGARPAESCDIGAYQSNAAVPTAVALNDSSSETSTSFARLIALLLVLSTATVGITRRHFD